MGRPKGAPNLNSRKVREYLKALDFDPLKESVSLFRVAMEENNLTVASKIATDLNSYCYPKLKAVEHSVGDGERFKDSFEEAFEEIGKANSDKRRREGSNS